jgi:hypothetical protein
VILDLPPGLWGFADAVLELHSWVSSGQDLPEDWPAPQWPAGTWEVAPLLVMTQDRGDLFAALEAWLTLRGQLPGLRPLLNRRTDSQAEVKRRIAMRFQAAMHLDQELGLVEEMPDSLGMLFRKGRLPRWGSAREEEQESKLRTLASVFGIGER